MSETDNETQSVPEDDDRTGQSRECRRCAREQGLVGKYEIWLCRQCFREIARGMGFKKYS